MENLPRKIEELASLIQAEQFERIEREGGELEIHRHNYTTKVVPGRKFTKIDVGSCGKYMIENETGRIYGIKAYGVVHRGHYFGTLETIHQWDWSGYEAYKRS